ncbi:LysR family transcriptional regulator [Pigmentiphaga sp. H8]|uniref:LysR family transcriptional regulator n=1 Tax=Pigmentiphaga sp. H8 TaxID=2488560 RepID=UPI000F5ADB78|nr:LysR family transcriptional regulator [Pigmentiphaga sp. H8]AZG10951.1 LysR family transcriptional regulator [Pigmentiphaga sp. H8]
MKIDQLRTFVAVVDTGALVEAGDRMGRTPAALSMTLKQIESELGGALFEGERKNRLTPLGRHVHLQAQRALHAFDAALAQMRGYARGGQGIARIAAVPSAATRLLPAAIARMRATHPGVRIDLRDIDSAAVIQAVSAGVVDFGIATAPASSAHPDLNAEPLLKDPFVLVCPAGHRLNALKRPVRWRDIDPAEFIANGLCSRFSSPELSRLVEQAPLNLHNTTSLLTFVAQGFGVTLLPTMAVTASRTVRLLPLADHGATRSLDLITQRDASLSPASQAMLERVLDCSRTMAATV